MLNQRYPEEFKKLFLLEFTKQLIKNSAPSEVMKLEIILREEDKENKNRIKQILREKENKFTITREDSFNAQKKASSFNFNTQDKPQQLNIKKSLTQQPTQRILRIPETKLPERLQYLKPTPTNMQLELGKLNKLIQDPQVQSVESYGADEKVIVNGVMGTKTTDVILSKEEIDQIIDAFSKATKIPIEEGLFKVVYGKLIFSAIVSNVVSSKFIIKKMSPHAMFRS